jgi:hypothetical protein
MSKNNKNKDQQGNGNVHRTLPRVKVTVNTRICVPLTSFCENVKPAKGKCDLDI